MSNTTPESPEDRPVGEHLETTPSEPVTAAQTSYEADEPPVTEPDEATTADAPIAESAVETDAADESGDAVAPTVPPVSSTSHVGRADTAGQTAEYGTTESRSDTAEYGTTAARSDTAEQPPVASGYAAAPYVAAQPVYVAAPQPPKRRGNRGGGILIALLSTVVYAIVSALVVLVIFLLTKRTSDIAMHDFVQYIGTASYYIPIIFFFLAFILLIAIVNRGGWWAYILGAFFVGVIVYFAYIGGVLLTIQAWQFSAPEVGRILSQLWANPLTIGAAIVAREVPIWFGAWIAARGRRVRERNDEAQRQYERDLAEGPQPVPRTT